MKLTSLLEVSWHSASDHVYRQWALKLQQELIELLPDDFEVNLTDLFLHAGQYTYGKLALRIRHPSYNGVLSNGEAMVFPRENYCVLLYSYKCHRKRLIARNSPEQLADDLQYNVQTNSI